MFKFSASVPADYPGTTVSGQTVGPVVWCTHKVADVPAALVAFNRLEFGELVQKGLPLLDDGQRSDLIRLLGGVQPAELEEALATAQAAEVALAEARVNLESIAETIAASVREKLADVIDLDAERAKRRPEPANAA